ncbi:MAG: hypothetical protein V1672_01555 [Candidatus Diapherotrites archaeon]
MADLKEQEETYRLLIRKIDTELTKFEKLKEKIKSKRREVTDEVKKAGFDTVPVRITPHSNTKDDLISEIETHIMSLTKTKNFISMKLESIMQEEELLAELKKKFKDSVKLTKLEHGEFELNFTDAETKDAYTELSQSTKLIENIKKTMQNKE